MIKINPINTNDTDSTYYQTNHKEHKLLSFCHKCGRPLTTSRLNGLCWICNVGGKK